MKKFYTLTELVNMPTLDTNVVYGELKEDTDKTRVWFDPTDNVVSIETFDYGNSGEWEIYDEYTAIDLPQNTVAEVCYKLHDGEVVFTKPAYVFRTPTSIYIEEAEYCTDLFRLEYSERTNEYIILVVDSEEFFINETVTDLFDVEQVLAQCEAAENVEDRSMEYLIFYIKELRNEMESDGE